MRIRIGFDKYMDSGIEWFFSDDRKIFVIHFFRFGIAILRS